MDTESTNGRGNVTRFEPDIGITYHLKKKGANRRERKLISDWPVMSRRWPSFFLFLLWWSEEVGGTRERGGHGIEEQEEWNIYFNNNNGRWKCFIENSLS